MKPKRIPSANPRVNVLVPHALRSKARKKAEGEGKSMSQLIVALLKGYVGKAA